MAQFEHPDTGKILNPITGNWVSKQYAKNQGFYSQARKATEKYFKENPDELVENDDASEKQLIDEQVQPDESGKERLDETERVEFDDGHDLDHLMSDIDQRDKFGADPSDEEFIDVNVPELQNFDDPTQSEGDQEYVRPHEEDEFRPQFSKMPEFPGVYTNKDKKSNFNESHRSKSRREAEGRPREEKKRYVRTATGGMRVVSDDE